MLHTSLRRQRRELKAQKASAAKNNMWLKKMKVKGSSGGKEGRHTLRKQEHRLQKQKAAAPKAATMARKMATIQEHRLQKEKAAASKAAWTAVTTPFATITITWGTKSEQDCAWQCTCSPSAQGCKYGAKCRDYRWAQPSKVCELFDHIVATRSPSKSPTRSPTDSWLQPLTQTQSPTHAPTLPHLPPTHSPTLPHFPPHILSTHFPSAPLYGTRRSGDDVNAMMRRVCV